MELTDSEQDELRAAIGREWRDPAVGVTIMRAVMPAVERILAAHDAQVPAELAAELEALAKEWDRAEEADPFAYTGAECAEMVRALLEAKG